MRAAIIRAVVLLWVVAGALPVSSTAASGPTSGQSARLKAASAWVAARIDAADQSAHWLITAAARPDQQRLVVTVPPAVASTPAQLAFRAKAAKLWRTTIAFHYKRIRPATFSCTYPFCDPPLRSGVRISASGVSCTGSFLARSRSDSKLYQFTAGHCGADTNGPWGTQFASGSVHSIGPVHNFSFNGSADAAIVRVDNPSGWRSRAWVQVSSSAYTTANGEYPIRAVGDSTIGMRICVTGSWFGVSHCGVVDGLDVTVDYGDVIVTGLVSSTLCATFGDSGAPIYARNTAYGLLSGGASDCQTFYQPIRKAEDVMRVNVSRDAG